MDLEIADLSYSSACPTTEAICGIDLGGNLILTLVDSTLSQSASAIVAGTADLQVVDGADAGNDRDGDICLTGGDCDGDLENDNDFQGLVTANARTVEILDSNSLSVGDITANLDIRLGAGDDVDTAANVAQTGTLFLLGDLTTTDATGQILLESDGGIQQDSAANDLDANAATASVITTSELLLRTTTDAQSVLGDFDLRGENVVSLLAADIGMDGQDIDAAFNSDTFGDVGLSFNNTLDLQIDRLSYASTCTPIPVEIAGLNVDGNLTLTVDGDLTQDTDAPVRVVGTVGSAGIANLTADEMICFNFGDLLLDAQNDNDFRGTVNATAGTIEIQDANDLIIGNLTAINDIRLAAGDDSGADESGDARTGRLQLNGDVLTTAADGQVLLQADDGVRQAVGSRIVANDLMVGSDDAALAERLDKGSGSFQLVGASNEVNRLAGHLEAGSLQLVNNGFLEVRALNAGDGYGSVCGTTADFDNLFAGAADALNGDFDLNGTLFDAANNGRGLTANELFNAAFSGYVRAGEIGIAISNAGTLVTEATVISVDGDVYLETTGASNLRIRENVAVVDPANGITAIAGADFALENSARLLRGSTSELAAAGIVFSDRMLADVLNENANADIDLNNLSQSLDVTIGSIDGALLERFLTLRVFWGNERLAGDAGINFDGLNPLQLATINSFLARGGGGPVGTTFHNIGDATTLATVNSGENLGAGPAGEALASIFVSLNPEFSNLMLAFNDSLINTFELAAGGDATLVDLNVSAQAFLGRGLVAAGFVAPAVETEEELAARPNAEPDPVAEIFNELPGEVEEPVFVSSPLPRYFVIVYFENQFAADEFERLLLGDSELDAKQAINRIKELLADENNGVSKNFVKWFGQQDIENFDANEIREILERAELELDPDIDSDWKAQYLEWLEQLKQEADSDADDDLAAEAREQRMTIPRGIYKILEVDERGDGSVNIKGDDIDRRFVPLRPAEDSGSQPQGTDMGFWDGEGSGNAGILRGAAPAVTSGLGLSLLAATVHQHRRQQRSADAPRQGASPQNGNDSPANNANSVKTGMFSRMARFWRRRTG